MKPLLLSPEIISIIEDAAKAPSGHNTQPWKFEIGENQIIIRPNFERRLKVVDMDDHALFISLGCALENLILSAKAHHFSPKVNFNFLNSKNEIIVDLHKSSDVKKDILYEFIQSRQSTRTEYDSSPIDKSLLDQLAGEVINEQVDIIILTDKDEIIFIVNLFYGQTAPMYGYFFYRL